MDIIDLLVNYIESKGLSQTDFANKIHYSQATLCRILNRKSPMTKPFLRKFLLSEEFEVKDLLQKRNIQNKIISCLSMIDASNGGLKYLETILKCIENKRLEYLKHKRDSH